MKNKSFFLFAFAFLGVCHPFPLRFPYTLLETGRREAGRFGVGREIFNRHTGKLSNFSPSGGEVHWDGRASVQRASGLVGPCGTPRRGQAFIEDECTEMRRGQGKCVLSGLFCSNQSDYPTLLRFICPDSPCFALNRHSDLMHRSW